MADQKSDSKADAKKQKVTFTVPKPFSYNPKGPEYLKKAREAKLKGPAPAPAVKNPGLLISSNDFPVPVKYGDTEMRVSPRARLKIPDVDLLPSQLPPGIHLKKKSAVKS
jgi:hypothetical protein